MGTIAKERPCAITKLASQLGYAASLRLERRGGRVAHHFPYVSGTLWHQTSHLTPWGRCTELKKQRSRLKSLNEDREWLFTSSAASLMTGESDAGRQVREQRPHMKVTSGVVSGGCFKLVDRFEDRVALPQ